MTFAKGVTSGYIPLGGVMVGERVAKVLIEQGGEFNHGYTYSRPPGRLRGGARQHPADPARASSSSACATTSARILRSTSRRWPNTRWSARPQTCGLMGALQLVQDKASGAPFDRELEVGMVCRGHCFGNGLIMRAVGDRMIVAPPLVMTRAQIDEMVGLIRKCLDLTLADVRQRGWL